MNILEIKDFSFSYPDQRKETLNHTDVTVNSGTILSAGINGLNSFFFSMFYLLFLFFIAKL